MKFLLEESCGHLFQHEEAAKANAFFFFLIVCMHRVETAPTFLASRVVCCVCL